ncbi:hypothetical protein F2Q69_00056129 [Brassica cretica]|uniref:Uncharacterized protein n=1 Tax=Brassica cretica TaxID=69181 RepID=A0A8S9N098_BRACR|nr:hypothetical protein F2Q69_00056129 [Brassica cretica]
MRLDIASKYALQRLTMEDMVVLLQNRNSSSDEEGNEINLPTSRPHRIFDSPSSYPQKLLRLRGGDDSPERHDGEADDGDGDGIGN